MARAGVIRVIQIDLRRGTDNRFGVPSRREGTDIWIAHFEDVAPDQLELLDVTEKERAARFRFEDDRKRWRAARAFLRLVLGAYLDTDPAAIRFDLGPQGKPSVTAGIEFNLSHSGDLVIIAISDEVVGVDVERTGRVVANEKVAARYYDDAEQNWIARSAEPVHSFYRLWTIKESAMKADGRGMSIPLRMVNVDVATLDGPGSVICRTGDISWVVTELDPAAGYCGAVASREPRAVRFLNPSERLI